jgi:hypothetical protein
VAKREPKKPAKDARPDRRRKKQGGLDPADLLKAWKKGVAELGGALASAPAGLVGDLARPLQQQADLVQAVLQRQLEFERDLVGRATAPLQATLGLMDQAAETLRAQAISFRAASTAFQTLASLLEQQADLMQNAGATVRDPLGFFRSGEN